MSQLYTIVIAIGRSKADGAMDDEEWNDFRKQVRAYYDVIYSETDGIGIYDGATEETAVFMGTTTLDIRAVKSALRELAYNHGQESIGLVTQQGAGTLVYARPPMHVSDIREETTSS
jgi:hypothetical protein